MSTETLIAGLGRIALIAALAAPLPAMAQDQSAETEAETAAEAEAESEAGAQPDGVAAQPPALTADRVVATVGDKAVRLGDVITLRRGLPQQYQQLPDEILTRGLIEQLVDQTLLAEKALADGLDTDPGIQFQLENQIRAVLAEAYMRAAVTERVTEETVRAEYETRYAEVEPEQEVRASHILVESEEQAQALMEELEGGADFAALAAEHGTDGTAQRGGDLGYFVKSDMVEPFADAAFEIAVGETGGPVQTPFGWHLIKVVDKRDRAAPAFEEVAGQIAGEMQQEAQRALIDDLRAEADVEIIEPPLPAGAIRNDDLLTAPAE